MDLASLGGSEQWDYQSWKTLLWSDCERGMWEFPEHPALVFMLCAWEQSTEACACSVFILIRLCLTNKQSHIHGKLKYPLCWWLFSPPSLQLVYLTEHCPHHLHWSWRHQLPSGSINCSKSINIHFMLKMKGLTPFSGAQLCHAAMWLLFVVSVRQLSGLQNLD